MAGAEHAPEQGGPFVAGVHGDADPAAFRAQGGEAGGIIVRPLRYFRVGAGMLLLSLQPDGSGHVPIVPENIKQGGKGLISLQADGDGLCIQAAHTKNPSQAVLLGQRLRRSLTI